MRSAAVIAAVWTGCIPARYGKLGADSGPDPVPEVADSLKVELGETQACPAPQSSPHYQEQGLDLFIDTDDFVEPAVDGHVDGPSMAVGDVDGDGVLELAIMRMENGASDVYHYEVGRYRALPGEIYPARSGLFADINGDAILDLMVGGVTPYSLSMKADKSWSFALWPALDPPEETETRSHVHDLSLADFDGDGVEDVFVVRTAVPFGDGIARNDRILRLSVDGMEVVMDAIPELVGLRHGFDAISFDEDQDGDMDTYLVHDHGATVGPSTLLHNNDGVFEDAAETCFCTLQVSAKGVDIADIDHDGRPELFITGAPLNHLLSQTEDGWLDISDTSGIREGISHAAGWGGIFLDPDNDGQKDILLVQGDRWNPGEVILPDGSEARFDEPIHLLQQQAGHFSDIAHSLGLNAQGSFRAVLATDLNQDGIEDLLITQASLRTLVYLSEGCTAANWIEIDAPIGSKVSISSPSGTQTDWSRVGRGFQSTARTPLHFGLGDDAELNDISITLADGQHFNFPGPFEARQRLRITR
jgi:hypothetical protein